MTLTKRLWRRYDKTRRWAQGERVIWKPVPKEEIIFRLVWNGHDYIKVYSGRKNKKTAQ